MWWRPLRSLPCYVKGKNSILNLFCNATEDSCYEIRSPTPSVALNSSPASQPNYDLYLVVLQSIWNNPYGSITAKYNGQTFCLHYSHGFQILVVDICKKLELRWTVWNVHKVITNSSLVALRSRSCLSYRMLVRLETFRWYFLYDNLSKVNSRVVVLF